jgi:hypothetical protein
LLAITALAGAALARVNGDESERRGLRADGGSLDQAADVLNSIRRHL